MHRYPILNRQLPSFAIATMLFVLKSHLGNDEVVIILKCTYRIS